jgi:hypothetical protein
MVVEPPIVLRHFNKDQESSKDVTTLDWNVRGVMGPSSSSFIALRRHSRLLGATLLVLSIWPHNCS